MGDVDEAAVIAGFLGRLRAQRKGAAAAANVQQRLRAAKRCQENIIFRPTFAERIFGGFYTRVHQTLRTGSPAY